MAISTETRRQLDAEIEQAVAWRTAELERANEDLEAFARELAHEFRVNINVLERDKWNGVHKPALTPLDEGIADTGDILDISGMGGVRFDFLAQAAHKLLKHHFIAAIHTPNVTHQRLDGQYLSGVDDERFQQAAFQLR